MAKINKEDLPFEIFLKDYFVPVVENSNRTIDELEIVTAVS